MFLDKVLVSTILTCLSLSLPVYDDIKYREIPDSHWIPSIIACAVFWVWYLNSRVIVITSTLFLLYLLVYIVTTGLMLAFYLILPRWGYLGSADSIGFLVVSVLNPAVLVIPSIEFVISVPLAIFLLSSVIMICKVFTHNILYNLRRIKDFKELTKDMSLRRRLCLFLMGRILAPEEYVKDKFSFPLYIPDKMNRLFVKVNWEPFEKEPVTTHVIVSSGEPYLLYLLVGGQSGLKSCDSAIAPSRSCHPTPVPQSTNHQSSIHAISRQFLERKFRHRHGRFWCRNIYF